MTDANLTHLYFLLDRSGSMQSIRDDTIGGFNAFIADQRQHPGDCRVTLAQFDTDYEVTYENLPIADVPKLDLQPREFRLLEYLMRHSGQTVTRKMLLENVWDYHFDPQTNVIDVHISRLRAKIDKGQSPLLHTIRGAGYMIRDGQR